MSRRERQIRIEVLVTLDQADRFVSYLRTEVLQDFRVTASIESVQVIRPDNCRREVAVEELSMNS